jgi:hypothetical protein
VCKSAAVRGALGSNASNSFTNATSAAQTAAAALFARDIDAEIGE